MWDHSLGCNPLSWCTSAGNGGPPQGGSPGFIVPRPLGASYLASSLQIRNLRLLDLSHNGLTDLSAQNLANALARCLIGWRICWASISWSTGNLSRINWHQIVVVFKTVQMNIWKILYLNCGERSKFMTDHRSIRGRGIRGGFESRSGLNFFQVLISQLLKLCQEKMTLGCVCNCDDQS